jgi:hypothetical protein
LSTTDEVDELLVVPYRRTLEPFWAPNNRVLWRGYLDDDIRCPFPRVPAPAFAIEELWTLDQLVDYMATWSAYKHSRSDPGATAALADAVARTRARVAADTLLPIRMPLKIVACPIAAGVGG